MIASCNNCLWKKNGFCEIDKKEVEKTDSCGAWLKVSEKIKEEK
jgi:hypothetical protein